MFALSYQEFTEMSVNEKGAIRPVRGRITP